MTSKQKEQINKRYNGAIKPANVFGKGNPNRSLESICSGKLPNKLTAEKILHAS